MPEALEIARDPSSSASRLIWRERKPQGRNDRLSRWNSSRFSRKRSCSWRCCGLRKVPLVQITGCSRFIWNHSNRTASVSQLAATNVILTKMIPAQAASYPWHQKLPRLGSDAEFAALRELLRTCSYSQEGICRRANVD